MTVKELKAILKGVPNDTTVVVGVVGPMDCHATVTYLPADDELGTAPIVFVEPGEEYLDGD